MNSKYLVKLLARVVGNKNVLASPPDLAAYAYDATGKSALPDAVVFPLNTAQVAGVMQVAHKEKVPVSVRGAGTNLTGGTVPHTGGIVLELSRMNRILEIDTARQRVIVEPGVINLDLQNLLAPMGYTYAPDPASQKSCTMGGNLGEDAGGPHCLKYGVTSNHIMAVEWVLSDGQVVQLGSPTDDNYGYDLMGPIVGSEGTMGVATKMVLRIMRLPEAYQTMVAIFNTLEDAGQAVSDIIAAGIVPGALELMDNTVTRAVEDSFHVGYPLDAEALLLIELDGVKEGLPRQAERVIEICKAAKAREVRKANSAAERNALWAGRRGAFGAVARVKPSYAVQDATVPRNKLVPMLREVNKISQKYNILIGNVAHAGDGNLHPLMMFDNRNKEESERVEEAGREILAECVKLDGSISGEHGIGLEKLTSMPLMFTRQDMELMSRVKRVFDPVDLLNPGKVIPQDAIKVTETGTEAAAANSPTPRNAYEEIVAVVGANNVPAEQQELPSYIFDDKKPLMVAFPLGADKISDVVKIASREGITITPCGNASKQNMGMPMTSTGIVLSLKHINRILEVDAPNLTAEVEAGINHAKLQRELAKQGLYFPLEPEDMELATLGGTLATNNSGPGRLLNGTARDLVLRITAVTPQGEVVNLGGKTVKNVSGFDVRKLFIGSWGTLGIITKAVLRLAYLPEDHKTVALRFTGMDGVEKVVRSILTSSLRPESIELLDAAAMSYVNNNTLLKLQDKEFCLLIGASGSKEIVERHVAEISSIAAANSAASLAVFSGAEQTEAWSVQQRARLYQSPDMVRCKVSLPVNKTAEMYAEINKIAGAHQLKAGVTGRLGNGILFPTLLMNGLLNDGFINAVSEIKQSTAKLGGTFIIESGPLAVREKFDTMSERSDYIIMRRLKQAFDPKNIFEPGKMVRK